MARIWIIPAGAGVLSALLFLAVAVGSPGALILGYLAPLPLFAMGLGAGLISAATAGATATALVGAIAGLIPAVTFAALLVAPAVVLVRQALLSRIDANGRLEWYPAGRLVAWLIGIGACLFVAATLFVSGGRGVEDRLRNVFGSALSAYVGPAPAAQLKPLIEFLAAYPAVIVVSWLAMIAVNAILAQGLLVRFQHGLRPSPPVASIELPRAVGLITAIAAALAVLASGWLEFAGRNLLVMLGLAFFFAGLGVVHGLLHQVGQRLFVLIGIYVFVLVFGWPILLVTVVGLVDHWVHFRLRFGGSTSGTV
ncbi:MAG: DUF2232 domain-containing protein [Proteobacteria bacterium]|nr:DUF2232 domain-containing protein [Pseudomonadota bacterium]